MNRNLKMNIVGDFTCKMLSDASGEKYDYESFLIKLMDNGKDISCILMIAFKDNDKYSVYREIIQNNLCDINSFCLSDKIHIITFYEEKYNKYESISFDMSDSFPIKAYFKDGSFEKVFFNKLIDFRNNLVKNRQVAREEDIFEFYFSFMGNYNQSSNYYMENANIRSKLRKIFYKK